MTLIVCSMVRYRDGGALFGIKDDTGLYWYNTWLPCYEIT